MTPKSLQLKIAFKVNPKVFIWPWVWHLKQYPIGMILVSFYRGSSTVYSISVPNFKQKDSWEVLFCDFSEKSRN